MVEIKRVNRNGTGDTRRVLINFDRHLDAPEWEALGRIQAAGVSIAGSLRDDVVKLIHELDRMCTQQAPATPAPAAGTATTSVKKK